MERHIYGPDEVLSLPNFRILRGQTYRQIAWGWVTKEEDWDGIGLLVAERCEPNDKERYGQLVIPGGGIRKRDIISIDGQIPDDVSVRKAAQREVEEETGVRTEDGNPRKFYGLTNSVVLKERGQAIALVEPTGWVWVYYRDSGKAYVGKPVDLKPVSGPRSVGQKGETEKVKYITLDEVSRRREDFTGAAQVILDMDEGRLIDDDCLFINTASMDGIFQRRPVED